MRVFIARAHRDSHISRAGAAAGPAAVRGRFTDAPVDVESEKRDTCEGRGGIQPETEGKEDSERVKILT